MPCRTATLTFRTPEKNQVLDIAGEVAEVVRAAGAPDGQCAVSVVW
jgi:thiamine phosphate synthase YjbQ (UPF0047 family)